MRFIQHRAEAEWFYRFVSPLYDRWVNPLFWTPQMRSAALELGRLEDAERVVDVGAGTGFATEEIVARAPSADVTMLDQSRQQLARAARKPALARCTRLLGDAQRLPFDTDSFDRYVSCGSIEYWPDPLVAIAEAYRVLRPGGLALVVGPLPPAQRMARWLAEAWMLFPSESDYGTWFRQAGFTDLETRVLAAPWANGAGAPYALAIAGRKPAAGASPSRIAERDRDDAPVPLRLARFALGSLAGAAFVPVGLALNLRARLRRHSRS